MRENQPSFACMNFSKVVAQGVGTLRQSSGNWMVGSFLKALFLCSPMQGCINQHLSSFS